MPLPLKHFYMIRHGQTEANAAQVMAGSLDSPLTAHGRAQAHKAKAVVEALPVKPVAVFHSPLSRARDTAFIINEALKAPMFEDPDLAEIHAGAWEGAPYATYPSLFNGWNNAPDGEPANDFFERVKRGKSRSLERFNDPILIVCHGGVMRAFGELYNSPVPGIFQNAHLYEFKPFPESLHFPWEVWSHTLHEETRTLLSEKSDIYTPSGA